MIIKILGMIDIITGLLFLLWGVLGVGNKELILLLGFILLIKGVVFVMGMNLTSIFDIIFGIIIIVGGSEVIIPKIVVIIISLFLLQKGIFSMF